MYSIVNPRNSPYHRSMTLQDIRREIEISSSEDRLYLLALLTHLTRRDQPSYKKHLADRAKEMTSGNQVSLDQIRRLHQSLEAEGL